MDRAPCARQSPARASRLAVAVILCCAWGSFAPAGPCLGGQPARRDSMGNRILELEPIEPEAPSQTLDDALRVILVSSPGGSPHECDKTGWSWGLFEIQPSRDSVTVDLCTPLQVMAEKYFKRLFPRLQVAPAPPPAQSYDLLLSVNVGFKFTGRKGTDREITVAASTEVEGKIGNQIVSQIGWVRGTGHASHPANLPWTADTDGLALARSAFAQAQSQMVNNFFYDPKIRDFLRARAAYRAQPPRLETTATFVDREALLPNGRLDAGERARLEVDVTNHGPGPAPDVKVLLGPGHRGVSIPEQVLIGDLEASSHKVVSIPISGDASLADGSVELNIKTVEKRGYEGRPLALRIETEGLAHPSLEIARVRLKESVGSQLRARDDQPVNGERIDCVVRVRNAGAAPVKAPVLTIVAPNDLVRVDKAQDTLPPIPAHAEAEGRLEVLIPATFAGHELTMTFVVNDFRHSRVVKKTVTWPVQLKPVIQLDARLAAITSLEPHGLEKIQVVLTAANLSALTARRAILRLRPQAGVKIDPQAIELGDLRGGSAPREVRLALEFPTDLPVGRGFFASHVVLDVTLSQDGFPPRQDLIPVIRD